jgi:hypothetical protein
MAYLIHSRNKYFSIVRWAQLSILGLSILTVLSSTLYFGSAVHASVMTFYAEPGDQDQIAKNAGGTSAKTGTVATAATQKPDPASTKPSPQTNTKPQNKTLKPSSDQQIKPSSNNIGTNPGYAQQQNTNADDLTPFMIFLKKRNAIEEAIKNNPDLIRNKRILRDYSRVWKLTYDLREKYRKKKGKRWERERIFSRQKDADIYDATHKIVDALYERIIKR